MSLVRVAERDEDATLQLAVSEDEEHVAALSVSAEMMPLYRALAPITSPAREQRRLVMREMYRALFATEAGLHYIMTELVLSVRTAAAKLRVRAAVHRTGQGAARAPLVEMIHVLFRRLPAFEMETVARRNPYSGERELEIALLPWGRNVGLRLRCAFLPPVLQWLASAFMACATSADCNAGGQYLRVGNFLYENELTAVYNPALFAGDILVLAAGERPPLEAFGLELVQILEDASVLGEAAREDTPAMVRALGEPTDAAGRMQRLSALRKARLLAAPAPALEHTRRWGQGGTQKQITN